MVVHRDLKPANILVTAGGTPKLLDFGIARILDHLAEHTMTVSLMTPAYASPEQIGGKPITTASDVYSLGVLLYELLTGSLPYRSTNTPSQLAEAICHQPPEFPRHTALPIHNDVKSIVLKAVRKEPERRYSSVEQLSEDLRLHLEGFPVRASQGTFRYRASKFIRRNWRGVGAAALVAIMLVASIIITTAQRNRADQQRLRAEAGEASNRHLLYAAQMILAYQAWETPNVGRAIELLDAQIPAPGQQDLRGFDWYLLWNLVRGRSKILPGATEIVDSVAFSPDHRNVEASSAGRAYVWDASKGTLSHSFAAEGPAIFSADGAFFTAKTAPGSIGLWNAESGEIVRSFDPDPVSQRPLSFAPDGALLATRSGEREVKLWNTRSGRVTATLAGHRDMVTSVSFSPTAPLLATTSRDHTVRLWNISSGKQIAMLSGHSWWVMHSSFSADGAMLATAGSGGEVKFWDVATRREIGTIPGDGTTINVVRFSPNANTVAVGGLDNLIRIYDVHSLKMLDTLRGHTDSLNSLAFSPDGGTLVSGSVDRTVRLWDLTKDQGLATFDGHTDWLSDVKFSPDGRTLAAASKDTTVSVWNFSEGRKIATLRHPQRVNGIAFSPDGNEIATADDDHLVRVWDSSGRGARVLAGHSSVVECVVFSPDGKTLASGSKNGEIALWDRRTGKLTATMLTPDRNLIWSLAFSPDGESLVAAEGGMPDLNSTGHVVTIWNSSTHRLLGTLEGHTRDIRIAAFAPDGRTIATGSHDGTIKFWDVKARREIASMKAAHKVDGLAFSADGKRLASAGQDKTVRIWDVATHQEVCVLTVPSQVNAVAFSPDSRVLAAASNDGKIRLWNAVISESVPRR
ncbi:MAG: protein kinase [Acidobacteriia bacterium]|nr:protein kinase [Terriglobia bacterium]